MKKIILASQSPRRSELLKNIGLEFSVIVTDTDESVVPKDLEPGLYVRELSFLKATAAAKTVKDDCYIIGADTVVVLDGKILGKPKDREEAFSMLSEMSGRVHSVYTSVTITDTRSMYSVSEYEKTDVYFRTLSNEEINYYIDNYSVLDKAGAYGIQEFASRFAERIDGDYFNIVGLPVCRLCKVFKREFGEDLI